MCTSDLAVYMQGVLRYFGGRLARFLSEPRPCYEAFSTLSVQQLQQVLQPCDLLLVEGNSRISTAIKYLTQSTWSHICLFVGDAPVSGTLIEADLINGVNAVPLDKYSSYNVRICRPVGLSDADRQQVIDYAVQRIGYQYDTKNIFDLMRYLIPTPPVPARYRRKLIAFGSGDPTKAICSTLVAQAFQSISYPILPRGTVVCRQSSQPATESILLERRHHSHFTPRDFDLSPYFEVVKPTLVQGFDYKSLQWKEE